jgi:carbon-monoxide dehydrogenase medium subunit
MKPAPFRWHGPSSVEEAVATLAEVGTHGKVLAGGQSLVPVLAMRLAEPADLVDINALAELDHVSATPEGVRVGALARHTRVQRDAAARAVQPLLSQGLALVAHPTIRNRGTTVGSIAHADPSGEMAADFFVGVLESALAPDELAVEAFFPALPAGAGSAFVEIARRHGDYALCGVGAIAQLSPDGAVAALRCAYLSVSEVPVVLDLTESWAIGRAAADAMAALDPPSDLHARADYRRHLAGVLTVRAAEAAIAAALPVAA